MSSCPGRMASRGFTLVEVVVALSILSLVLVATLTAMRTFGKTQGSLDRRIARMDEVRTVSSFLRDSMDSTVYAQAGGLSLGGSAPERAHFAGSPDWVEWKAPILFGESYGGTYVLRLSIMNGDLTLQWQEPPRFGVKELSWEGAQSRVLVEGAEEFTVGYLAEFGAQWVDVWDESRGPALVRFNIKSGHRYWPELIMQVHR